MRVCETALFLLPVETVKMVNLRRRAKLRGDQSIRAEIWGFLKFRKFNDRSGQEGETVSLCQISWRLVKLLRRYGDFSISQDGGRRHLGFLNIRNFNGQ